MARTKRNPGVNWDTPIQGQNPRQQARFLLLVEQAAAIRKGFSADCSVVVNPATKTVLEVAGVPVDQLDPGSGFSYFSQLDGVLKSPWKENRKHPHYAAMDTTKHVLFNFSCAFGEQRRMNDDDWFVRGHQETASQRIKYVYDGNVPSVTLAYRHLIPDYGKAIASSGGDLKQSGMWFGSDDLAAINAAIKPVTARLKAEAKAIRDQRRAEYKERFGHQPSNDSEQARFREEAYAAFGMSTEEWFVKQCAKFGVSFGAGATGSHGSQAAASYSASTADYRLLGLAPGSSLEEIQGAFRQLAKQHHPDVGGDAVRFQEISAAYARVRGVD